LVRAFEALARSPRLAAFVANPDKSWSPVFVPDTLLPVTVPVAATDVGVMAPSVNEMTGVVVGVATVPVTPFAGATETLFTVPVPVVVALTTNALTSLSLNVWSESLGAGSNSAVSGLGVRGVRTRRMRSLSCF